MKMQDYIHRPSGTLVQVTPFNPPNEIPQVSLPAQRLIVFMGSAETKIISFMEFIAEYTPAIEAIAPPPELPCPPQSKKWHTRHALQHLLAYTPPVYPNAAGDTVFGIIRYTDPDVERVNAPALVVMQGARSEPLRKIEFTWEDGGWLISLNVPFAPDRLPACAVVESTFPVPMAPQRLYGYFQGKTN
jgi:hypothetical protein